MLMRFVLTLGLVISAAAAQAQAVYEKPIYNPETKSYFELVRVTQAQQEHHKVGMVPEASFERAASFAAARVYKGTKGRLAIVKNQETHEFIMSNLRPNGFAFIGLRYYCKERQLRWITGENHPANGFKAWAAKWDAGDGPGCASATHGPWWMGVAYSGIGDGFRWVARGYAKNWNLYIVEYPTGQP
jgi:Lectin C-type domain